MEFEWPNDSRTPSKRDEIAPPPHSPKAARRSAEKNPHLRRSRDIPPAKTSTLPRAVGEFGQALGGPAHVAVGSIATGGANCRSSHVRNACPLATVDPKKADCLIGQLPTFGWDLLWSLRALFHLDAHAGRAIQQALEVEACELVLRMLSDVSGERGYGVRIAGFELGKRVQITHGHGVVVMLVPERFECPQRLGSCPAASGRRSGVRGSLRPCRRVLRSRRCGCQAACYPLQAARRH